MSDREARRFRECSTLTVAQVAARGDWLRLHCLDCQRERDIEARRLVRHNGHKIVATLKPVCASCQRWGRKGVGLHKPGRRTYLEILWPDDRP
jgi:hypothetical protein